MKYLEFTPKIAIKDILDTPAFKDASQGLITFVDAEKTLSVVVQMDASNIYKGSFLVRVSGVPPEESFEAPYLCQQRAKRASTPGQKVWVIRCRCYQKITAYIYYSQKQGFGCKVCLKLKAYNGRYAKKRLGIIAEQFGL